jgi:hypothetical protein
MGDPTMTDDQADYDAPDYQLLYEGTLRNIERMARQPARVRMPAEIRRLDAGRVTPPGDSGNFCACDAYPFAHRYDPERKVYEGPRCGPERVDPLGKTASPEVGQP